MRVLHSKKKLVVLLAALAVVGSAAAVAIPAVISQQVIVDGTAIHYRVVKSVADGLDSGWHIHPGLAIVQVQEGALQIYQGSCTPRRVGTGETYIEIPYEPVRGVATGRVVWTTTFLVNGPDAPTIPLSSYSPQNQNPCPGT
jgi:hypothetical protein